MCEFSPFCVIYIHTHVARILLMKVHLNCICDAETATKSHVARARLKIRNMGVKIKYSRPITLSTGSSNHNEYNFSSIAKNETQAREEKKGTSENPDVHKPFARNMISTKLLSP